MPRCCELAVFPPSVWQTPEILVEIETAWSLSGYLLVCFSAGRSCPENIKYVWGLGIFLFSYIHDLSPSPS